MLLFPAPALAAAAPKFIFDYELEDFLLRLFATAFVVAALLAVNWVLLRRHREMGEERRFSRRIVMLTLTVFGLVVILLLFPIAEESRPLLVTLVGLILTAVIGLASTTFIANVMAGMMLRAVRSFRPGDFVRVGEHFGRVTERGLFHTEIQTEDRDLITLPNLYLVSNPVRVVRYSGTVVTATLSLGYDVSHHHVRPLLLQAAKDAGLTDPFVQIQELGDFSITYSVAGFLTEVKQLLTARSHLRSLVLDTLHGAGIEIVSPTVMAQRRLQEGDRLVPPDEPPTAIAPAEGDTDDVPEELIFDKAEEAERVGQLRTERDQLAAQIAELGVQLKQTGEAEADRARLEREVEQRRKRAAEIDEQLDETKSP